MSQSPTSSHSSVPSDDFTELKADSILSFAKILDRLRRKQLEFSIKLENEKSRKKYLEECVQSSRLKYYEIQTKTKNGWVARESYIANNRTIQLGEQKLQASKIKLSLAKTENIQLHSKIDELRKEKLLQLKIYKDAQKSLETISETVKMTQADISKNHSRKQQIEQAILAAKKDFAVDRKDYVNELAFAKNNISTAQQVILNSIRDKMKTYNNMYNSPENRENLLKTTQTQLTLHLNRNDDNEVTNGKDLPCLVSDANNMHSQLSKQQLRQYDKSSNLHSDNDEKSSRTIVNDDDEEEKAIEAETFALYTLLQTKVADYEQLRSENHRKSKWLKEEERKLYVIEKTHGNKTHVLDSYMKSTQEDIKKHQRDYDACMEIVHKASDKLISLYNSIAIDNDVNDWKLVLTGVTSTNISELLRILEQRIDDLIQLSHAASRKPLQHEDFIRLPQTRIIKKKGDQGVRPTVIPRVNDQEESKSKDKDDHHHHHHESTTPVNIELLKNDIATNRKMFNVAALFKNKPVNVSMKAFGSMKGFGSSQKGSPKGLVNTVNLNTGNNKDLPDIIENPEQEQEQDQEQQQEETVTKSNPTNRENEDEDDTDVQQLIESSLTHVELAVDDFKNSVNNEGNTNTNSAYEENIDNKDEGFTENIDNVEEAASDIVGSGEATFDDNNVANDAPVITNENYEDDFDD